MATDDLHRLRQHCEMTQAQKAILYDQTIRALEEMMEGMRTQLIERSKEQLSCAEDRVRCFYQAGKNADNALIAQRLQAFYDIHGMMTR